MRPDLRFNLRAQSREAQHSTAVCFCCDDGYLPYAVFAASRLAELHPNRDFDLVIASPNQLNSDPAVKNDLIRWIEIDTADAFSGFGVDARRTDTMYLRLALPSVLSGAYDRILYLDADVMPLVGGIDCLLNADMGGMPLAAVRDNIQWRTPGRKPTEFTKRGLPASPYFNSGVLMMDVVRFNQEGWLEKILEFGNANPEKLLRHDQTLLNYVLSGHWAEMSPRWNWQFTWASWIYALSEDARILHFIGPRKPWSTADGRFPQFVTREYRSFLANHFPEQMPPQRQDSPLMKSRFMTKTLLKHALSQNAMRAYLSRFEDDFTLCIPPR